MAIVKQHWTTRAGKQPDIQRSTRPRRPESIQSMECSWGQQLQGRTFSTLIESQFERAHFFETHLSISELKTRFMSGAYAEALTAAEKAKPLLSAVAAQILFFDYYYYAALTVAALCLRGFSRFT
jgi:hypothetical protein